MNKILVAIVNVIKGIFGVKAEKVAKKVKPVAKRWKAQGQWNRKRKGYHGHKQHYGRKPWQQAGHQYAQKPHRNVKPNYEALEAGSILLVDGANLLGSFDASEATQVLVSVAEGLKERGYGCRVFLEHRSWKYHAVNQSGDAERAAFESACKALGVTIVGREADLPILQMLRSVANSVALTNDHYADYAKVFPEMVGSSRLRGFSVAEINGQKLISIDGLSEAIPVARMRHVRSYTKDVLPGLCGHGNVLLDKGNLSGATRCFEKMVARHDVDGYAGLSEVYMHQGDMKNARKFAMLGEKLSRRMREKARRSHRLAAEFRRAGLGYKYAECA